MEVEARRGDDGFAQGDVAGEGDDGDTAARDGGLHGDFKDTRHLIGLRDEFAIVAALRKEMLRVGLLEIAAADFVAGDLRGDGQNGDAAAVAVIESVDEVEIAGAAAAGAYGEVAGEMGFSTGGEGGDFFVAEMDPVEFAGGTDGFGDAVEGVAGDAVDAAHAGG